MNIHLIPTVDRPREKLIAKGQETLHTKELLAILLRTGIKGKHVLQVAEELITKYPLPRLASVSIDQLREIAGIDQSKACVILAAMELGKRLGETIDKTIPVIETPADALPLFSEIRDKKKEHFVVLYVNTRNQVILKEVVSIGTLNASLVNPREVFEPAVRTLAAGIILAHNHPSGEAEPSDADIAVTKRMCEAGKLMGIEVLDHIIITKGKWYSFRDHGSMP
jgi:DNA repair protein RadC